MDPNDDPLDEKNQTVGNPYGKYVSTVNNSVNLNLQGDLQVDTFDLGYLVTFTVGTRRVFSHFIQK